MNPEVLRYIQENRGTYTREAITQTLLDAGHSRADIDAAWAAAEPEADTPPLQPATPPVSPAGLVVEDEAPEAPTVQRVLRTPRFWVSFVAYTVLSIGLMVGFGALGVAAFLLPLYLLALVAGLVAGIVLWRRDRPVAMGLASAALLVFILPFAFILIFAGLCIVQGYRA
jgi:hypothetical protein